MAKKPSQSSPAARGRSRQRRASPVSGQPSQQGTRNKRKVQHKSNRGLWFTLGGVAVAIVAVVGFFIYLSSQSANSSAYPLTAANPTIVKEITTIDPSVLVAVGTGSGKVVGTPTKLNGATALTGPTGKPEVFYEGAEYCPNCAAERWSIIVALSRFGIFHNLSQERSVSTDVDPNTATFSFYHSSYTSQYIDFVPLEQESYEGVTQETPTASEQQIINAYNPGEGYPFIDIANQYSFSGASYDPATLSNLDWQSIADSLSDPQSLIAKCILGTANYLAATICQATNQQPASVCKAAPIPQLEQSIGQTSSHTTAQSFAPGSFMAVIREGDITYAS